MKKLIFLSFSATHISKTFIQNKYVAVLVMDIKAKQVPIFCPPLGYCFCPRLVSLPTSSCVYALQNFTMYFHSCVYALQNLMMTFHGCVCALQNFTMYFHSCVCALQNLMMYFQRLCPSKKITKYQQKGQMPFPLLLIVLITRNLL
jgi:hypothetical protein